MKLKENHVYVLKPCRKQHNSVTCSLVWHVQILFIFIPSRINRIIDSHFVAKVHMKTRDKPTLNTPFNRQKSGAFLIRFQALTDALLPWKVISFKIF